MDDSSKIEWVKLPDFPKYEINKEGEIRNSQTGRILKIQQRMPHPSYVQIRDKNGKMRAPCIEELVAEMFLVKDDKSQSKERRNTYGEDNSDLWENMLWKNLLRQSNKRKRESGCFIM